MRNRTKRMSKEQSGFMCSLVKTRGYLNWFHGNRKIGISAEIPVKSTAKIAGTAAYIDVLT